VKIGLSLSDFTLDVLTNGRAWLGIGAAWFEREHLGPGVPWPSRAERFERLEETPQIAHLGRGDAAADTEWGDDGA
jgi:alkanesulfonate monooxygenase SsuD/methylene tetrahydromethanopterin reductase-like flavin-dependent oxidoreductase (luciferase family)